MCKSINWLTINDYLLALIKIPNIIILWFIILFYKLKDKSSITCASGQLKIEYWFFFFSTKPSLNRAWIFLKQRLDPNPRNNYQTMQHISLDYDFSPNLNHTMRRSRTLKKEYSTQVSKNGKKCKFHSPSST